MKACTGEVEISAAHWLLALPCLSERRTWLRDGARGCRCSSVPRRGVKVYGGHGGFEAESASSNPFCGIVGTRAEYTVDPHDPNATLEQIEGAIQHHEKGIESSLQRTLRRVLI